MPCRLLLIDDHLAHTRGLAALLGREPDLSVSGQFANGEELLGFLKACPALPAELLLLDLQLLPPHAGLDLLAHLRWHWPRLRVIALSSAISPALVAQVAAAGAHGLLDKAAEAKALLTTIQAVHLGQLVFPAWLHTAASPAPAAPAE